MSRIIAITVSFIFLSGCSSMMRSTGISVFGDILHHASPEIEKEKSWEYFREAIPAQLKLIETLASQDQSDPSFSFVIVQGHAAYAFAVWETLYIKDQILLEENSAELDRALYHYSLAIRYGAQYLSQKGLSFEKLLSSKEPLELINQNLDAGNEFDKKIVLFTGQSLAGLINLNRDQSIYLTALPAAKAMFDWVCKAEPNIYYGACPIFYGSYEAGRPRMLGGNPKKGKEIFEKAINQYPENYLIRMAFIQYYSIPLGDEEVFKNQQKALDKYYRKLMSKKVWRPFDKTFYQESENAGVNLLNATAIKRYQILNQLKEELF